ncbi:kinase-like domain-containing protein [Scenedesmus sp. NREL 46B-D3]|nr:kinase-like domain-containing protein [Scenedesmus sp. NREL 46B-D3]
MLSINHPNVVRAYHYITYTSKAVPAEASLPGAAGGGGGGAPAGRLPGLKGHRLQAGGAAAASTPSQPGSTGNSKTTHSSSAHTPTSAACSQAEASPQQPRDAASQQYAAKLSALKQVLRPGNAQQSQQQQLHSEMQQQPRRASEVGSGQDNSLGQHALAHTLGSDTPHTADQAAQQQQQQQHGLQPGGCAAAGLRQSPPHVCPSAGDSWARDSRPFPVSATSGLHAGLDSSQLQRTPGGTLSVMLRSRTWLVQELCDCGTLCSWVGDTALGDGNTEQELQLLLLLQDAARGVAHLHSRSIVHGDLNARNVLVRSADGGGVVAKLADLGISRVIKQHSTHRTTNTVGTMSHMPPELLRYGRMSPAVDVYAFGVMMWELYTGKIAFKHLHYGQFFEQVVLRNNRPPLPPLMPEDYSLLLTSCWAMDPAARPCIAAVLDCLKLMIQERQLNI